MNKKWVAYGVVVLVVLVLAGWFVSESDAGNGRGPKYMPNRTDLPPDPGEEGDLTVEGVDSDEDGVRDDVQLFIVYTYENDTRAQELLLDYARAQQKYILSESKEEALANAGARRMSIECAFYLYPNEAMRMTDEIEGKMTNTEERVLAYMKIDNYLGGETFAGTPYEELPNICAQY